jgi:acyl-CoA reductase-like NAD-dependent aldehyde dehydrogenase
LDPFQNVYDAQKTYFAMGATRGYEWRVKQLDRMAKLLSENEAALQKAVAVDFKNARQEFVFETAAPLDETQSLRCCSNVRSLHSSRRSACLQLLHIIIASSQ